MRHFILFVFAFSILDCFGQQECASYTYYQQEIQKDASLAETTKKIESFINNRLTGNGLRMSPAGHSGSSLSVIRIPVVVHVLYNNEEQKISAEQVLSQIEALNRDFRKTNPGVNVPDHFKALAADCFIEFVLASLDPQGKPTRGIIWKKTHLSSFGVDDRIKFSREGGDDAWDSDRYLNIWVGKLSPGWVGYASSPGAIREKDGIVIRYNAFGTRGTVAAPYNLGRTAVHETGHWLGLKHIWGDRYCGDDEVADTPPQKGPTQGCPLGVISSCDNASTGSMYMNFMDITYDVCTNLFTLGQRDRMRAVFAEGGPRHAILSSNGGSGLSFPFPAELPVEPTSDQRPLFFPNPATNTLTIHAAAEIGEYVIIYNHIGQRVMQEKITSSPLQININTLNSGLYFIKIGRNKTLKLVKAGFE